MITVVRERNTDYRIRFVENCGFSDKIRAFFSWILIRIWILTETQLQKKLKKKFKSLLQPN